MAYTGCSQCIHKPYDSLYPCCHDITQLKQNDKYKEKNVSKPSPFRRILGFLQIR